MNLRIGQGFDSHNIQKTDCTKKPLVIGGIIISSEYEIVAHSDGDVLLHAFIDSILGALSLGDIGEWFNDKDSQYENIKSELLLTEVLNKSGYKTQWEIVNLDTTVVLQDPKIGDYKPIIKKKMANLLGIEETKISIKYKTFENPSSTQIWAYSSLLLRIK